MVLSMNDAFIVAGIFAIMASALAFHQIYKHLRHEYHPALKRNVARILLMIPVYALESWLGLRYVQLAMYFDVLRECYEAIVLYSFYQMLAIYLGGEANLHDLLKTKPPVSHMVPFCCMKKWRMHDNSFHLYTQIGALQYIVVRPFTAIIAFVLTAVGDYGDSFDLDEGYVYITFINSCSQLWAMYCLVLFYMACKTNLKPINPVGKFICVKAIVFATYWQSVALAICSAVGVFDNLVENSEYTDENVVSSIQDFVVCIEMFLFAIAHSIYFPYTDFPEDETQVGVKQSLTQGILSTLDVTDQFMYDTKHVIQKVQSRSKKSRAAQYGEELPDLD
jgi:hypothetical protein